MNKKLIRLTESDLKQIVKESVNRILGEDKEGYNQVMSTLNNPTAQKGLKKAWNKERKRNPNADYDTFEYNHALNLQNKKRKEDERYATVKESAVNEVMNKKIIRLTEQDLHKIVKESINKILSEVRRGDDEYVKGPDGYSHYYINHKDKTVSPIHGYYSSKAPKKYAERNGYKYIEPKD